MNVIVHSVSLESLNITVTAITHPFTVSLSKTLNTYLIQNATSDTSSPNMTHTSTLHTPLNETYLLSSYSYCLHLYSKFRNLLAVMRIHRFVVCCFHCEGWRIAFVLRCSFYSHRNELSRDCIVFELCGPGRTPEMKQGQI